MKLRITGKNFASWEQVQEVNDAKISKPDSTAGK